MGNNQTIDRQGFGAGVNIIVIILTSGRVGRFVLSYQARAWSILQPKAWCCAGAVLSKG